MSKVLVNESSLISIGNAIREKNNTSNTYKPSEMATAILNITTGGGSGGITLPEEALVISGNCNYMFYDNNWLWFINAYKNQITTKDLVHTQQMFSAATDLIEIPFDLNYKTVTSAWDYHMADSLFMNCQNLISIPKINNCTPNSTSNLFQNCWRLRYLPDNLEDYFDWSYIDSQTSAYSSPRKGQFQTCHSLRSIPMGFLNHGNPVCSNSNSIYYYGFYNCYALDEIIGLPIPHAKSTDNTTWTSNAFYYTFNNCSHLKNMTFAVQEDGTPYSVKWKSQVIDLSYEVGYAMQKLSYFTNYNSGMTADKEINDDASYQALKDDPDAFATLLEYSRYNHDSAVATINSLPDASATGTNTIKFKGASGSATDEGAINTLTEEEIAVATAKGWTVTLV